MKVLKTTVIEVENLGAKIRSARKADKRDLTIICAQIPMSANNWYRIENEQQTLPYETLQKIEQVLGVNFGVKAK